MVNNILLKYSNSLVIRGAKFKTTVNCHCTHTRMNKMQKTDKIKYCKDVE